MEIVMKKESTKKMFMTTTTMDEKTRERARKLGNGNLSLGIRIAVSRCKLRERAEK
jgi:hypothetical protein